MPDQASATRSSIGLSQYFRVQPAAWILVLSLLLLAAGLRFHDLTERSLWADELFSASVANDHPMWPTPGVPFFERLRILDVQLGQSFWTVKAADQSPPLFELLASLSIGLFGLGEFAVRLPSVLAGVALVLWLGWRSVRATNPTERSTLAWAALLCAVAPALVAYGQEARVYSLGTLWAGMLATGWYQRWVRGWRAAMLPGWGEVGVFVLACYSHNNLIVLSAILLTAYGLEALRRRDWRAVVRLCCVPLAYLPWFVLSIHTLFFTMGRGIAWTELNWPQAVVEALRTLPDVFPLVWLKMLGLLLLVRVLLERLDFGMAARFGLDRLRARGAVPLVALLGVVGLYFVLVAGVVARSGVYHPRHLLFMVPFMALVAGIVVSGLRARAAQALAAALLVLAVVPALQAGYHRPTNDFRGAYRFALAYLPKQAPIVGITPADRRFYVDVLEGGSKRPLVFLSEYDPVAYAQACRTLIQAGTDTAVVTHPLREPFVRALFDHCKGHFVVGQRMTGDHVIAEWWRRVDQAPGILSTAPAAPRR